MTRLLLVRHGETAWNAEGRLQGQAQVELSDRGLEQARALAPLVRSLGPASAVSSDLRRAVQTVEALGFPDARLDPGLRELGLGQWEGRTSTELQASEPEAYAAWRGGRSVPPGGESGEALVARVQAALEDALRSPSPVLVVTHGGIVAAAIELLVGLDKRKLVPVGPASLTVLDVPDGETRLDGLGGAKLHSYNVTAPR